jgi:hypothetical protein
MGETAWQSLDVLSPAARAAVEANAGQAYTRLVLRGDGWAPARQMLDALRPETILTTPIKRPDDARALLAGLWLWHDWLDESHQISQSLATPTGSFWHAIMHRREGDFSNSKYWYARCRHHAVLDEIAQRARSAGMEWTGPDAFVDLVEAVHRSLEDPLHPAAVRLQRLEWRALFEYCVKQAAGT